jgi:20S proteasome alpha/beta subunit
MGDFLAGQQHLSPDLVLRLTFNIEHERLQVALLIVGVDSSGAHIYLVEDPGASSCYDAVGFCAIGSGEHHAELAFIRSNYSESVSLKDALLLAYRAKRDAETAPGVGGRYTDLAYMDDEGLHVFSKGDLEILDGAYEALQKTRSIVDDEVSGAVESLALDEGG